MTTLADVGYQERSASDWYHLEKKRRASSPDTSHAQLMAEARAEFAGTIVPQPGGSVIRLDGTPRKAGPGRGRSFCSCGGVKSARAKACAACVAKLPCKWNCGNPRASSTKKECNECRNDRRRAQWAAAHPNAKRGRPPKQPRLAAAMHATRRKAA